MENLQARKINRWKNHNYSRSGYYYVTICTRNHINYFGEINNNSVRLNEYGNITKCTWKEIPIHFSNIELDEFIVMPNHIHGIIHIVGDADLRPLQNNDRSKNILSLVIHGFKLSASRRINNANKIKFSVWQRSFYDHIIRTEVSLNKIRNYIKKNPTNWFEDSENRFSCFSW